MLNSSVVKIGDISVGGESPLVFILGPCQIENRDHALFMAEKIAKVCEPSSSKFNRLKKIIKKNNCDFYILFNPAGLSWLLNIRGTDLKYSLSLIHI